MPRDPRTTFVLREPAGYPRLSYRMPLDVPLAGYIDRHGRRVFIVPSSTGQIHCYDGEQLTVEKYRALQVAYRALGAEAL